LRKKKEIEKEIEMESKSLMEYLKGLNDPRKEKGKHHEQEVILARVELYTP
jgi:hypothetical protein